MFQYKKTKFLKIQPYEKFELILPVPESYKYVNCFLWNYLPVDGMQSEMLLNLDTRYLEAGKGYMASADPPWKCKPYKYNISMQDIVLLLAFFERFCSHHHYYKSARTSPLKVHSFFCISKWTSVTILYSSKVLGTNKNLKFEQA